MRTCTLVTGLGVSLLVACSTTVDSGGPAVASPPAKDPPQALAALSEAATTVAASYALKTPKGNASGANPSLPENLASYIERGFGELVSAPGESHTALGRRRGHRSPLDHRQADRRRGLAHGLVSGGQRYLCRLRQGCGLNSAAGPGAELQRRRNHSLATGNNGPLSRFSDAGMRSRHR